MERQVGALVAAGYPELAGETPQAFRARFDGLVPVLAALVDYEPVGDAHLPFAVIVTRDLIDPELRVERLRLAKGDRPGILDRNHFSDDRPGLAPYDPRPDLELPSGPVYAIVQVERGDEYRGRRPEEAVDEILARGRTPLTIDEGISLVATHPGFLERNHCFMLGASTRGDQRMPALWIAQNAPKLGWCFQRNPHTWLGMASAARRVWA
jgi:hypothetical protein